MNKCPICGKSQKIDDLGVITRKKITCSSCENDLLIIEAPSSFFVDTLFIVAFLAIYAPLIRAGYSWWVGIPIVLFGSLIFAIVKVRIRSDFIIGTADNSKAIGKAERMNLLLLAGIVGLIASVLYLL
jgi:uncharacterized protein (DUF983 family)